MLNDMKELRNSPFLIFIFFFLLISIPLFIFPIQLFPGIIETQNGLQHIKHEAPLSLSFFVGLGYDKKDLIGVTDFYLKPVGYLLAFIYTIGIPAIIAFRIGSRNKKS